MRLIASLTIALASLLFAGQAYGAATTLHTGAILVVKPNLSIKSLTASAPAPAGSIQQCNGSEVVLTIRADVANLGNGDSPANNDQHALSVQDSKLTDWTAGRALPAIPHGTDIVVPIDVPAYHDGPKMIGAHTFSVTLNGKASTVAYTVPDGFCGLHAPKTLSLATTTVKLPPAATQSLSHIVVMHPGTTIVKTQIPVVTIAPPSGLGITNDVKVCIKHTGLAGAFICPTLVTDQTQLLLVWDWSPCGTGCQNTIDGFHIYVVSTTATGAGAKFTQHTFQQNRTFAQQQTDPNLTIVSLNNWGTLLYPDKCIVVTAYRGQSESADSNPYCATTPGRIGQYPQTMTLMPQNLKTSWTRISIDEQYCNQGNVPFSNLSRGLYSGIVGGYALFQTDSRQCNNDVGNGAAYYARTAFFFDLSQLAGKSIISAKLVTGYFQQTNYYYTGQKLPICDTELTLGIANTDYQSGFDPTQPLPMTDFIPVGTTVQYVDFTDQLRHWLTNQPNYGMVVRGGLENLGAFRSWGGGPGVCLGADIGVELVVTYT